MRPLMMSVLSLALSLLFVPAPAGAGEPLYKGATAGNVQLSDNSMRLRDFDTPFNLAMVFDPVPELETSVRCTVKADDGDRPRRGAKAILDLELLDLDGNTLFDPPKQNRRTDKNGDRVYEWDLPPSTLEPPGPIVAVLEVDYRGNKKVTSIDTNCATRSRRPCLPSDTNLCLQDDRFKVQVDWRDGSQSGPGMVLDSDDDSGLFYFFSPGASDLLVQLLSRCVINDHFWVFYAATTDVEYTITVTDTEAGSSRSYTNPSQPFEPILDTAAFATCP